MTFDEAREAAVKLLQPQWGGRGTLFASFQGYEDSKFWYVNCGAEEWLIDEDLAYMQTDAPVVMVDKKTGDATETTYLDIADTLEKATAVDVG